MQGYFGGIYASNFNSFGKMYRVMIQAEPDATKNLESLNGIKVRGSDGEMAPISQFVSLKKIYGPDVISRFNLYTSIQVMVSPAAGYSSGQALQAIAEVANDNLPAGFGYELGGMAREEAQTTNTTGIILVRSTKVTCCRWRYCCQYLAVCWVASCLSTDSRHWAASRR